MRARCCCPASARGTSRVRGFRPGHFSFLLECFRLRPCRSRASRREPLEPQTPLVRGRPRSSAMRRARYRVRPPHCQRRRPGSALSRGASRAVRAHRETMVRQPVELMSVRMRPRRAPEVGPCHEDALWRRRPASTWLRSASIPFSGSSVRAMMMPRSSTRRRDSPLRRGKSVRRALEMLCAQADAQAPSELFAFHGEWHVH